MEMYEFPASVKIRIDRETRQKIENEQQASIDRKKKIRFKRLKSYATKKHVIYGLIGFFIGGPIGLIIGLYFANKKDNFKEQNDKFKEQNDKKYQKLIAEEDEYTQNLIDAYQKQGDAEYRNYVKEFEENARQLSVKFAQSALANQVVAWMTERFCQEIDATNRQAHIQTVKVPFAFKVYTDRILCNAGDFDFNIQRCEKLPNPLAQTALARAISSMLQLNITMKYPTDISGPAAVVNDTFSYEINYVAGTVTYTAANGNYQSVQSWEVPL